VHRCHFQVNGLEPTLHEASRPHTSGVASAFVTTYCFDIGINTLLYPFCRCVLSPDLDYYDNTNIFSRFFGLWR
jgi:hypothetical protein